MARLISKISLHCYSGRWMTLQCVFCSWTCSQCSGKLITQQCGSENRAHVRRLKYHRALQHGVFEERVIWALNV